MLALKENHPILHHEVRGFFEDGILTSCDGIQHDSHVEETQAHDRDEVRRVWTSSELDWVPEAEEWTHLHSLICVEAERTILGKPTTINQRFYISSLPDLAAAEAAGTVRAPWGVENQLHWVLDVAFREDDARARKGHSSSRRPPRSGASRASGFGQGGTIDIYWRSSGIRCDRPAWSPPSILCLRSGCGC